MAPAQVSALILYVFPSIPMPIGATTGIKSDFANVFRTLTSISFGSPTKPRLAFVSVLDDESYTFLLSLPSSSILVGFGFAL